MNYSKWFIDVTENFDFSEERDLFTQDELSWLAKQIDSENLEYMYCAPGEQPIDGMTRHLVSVKNKAAELDRIFKKVKIITDVFFKFVWNPYSRQFTPENEFLERSIEVKIDKYQEEWFIINLCSNYKITLGDGVQINKRTYLLGRKEVVYKCDGFYGLTKLLSLVHIEDDKHDRKYAVVV